MRRKVFLSSFVEPPRSPPGRRIPLGHVSQSLPSFYPQFVAESSSSAVHAMVANRAASTVVASSAAPSSLKLLIAFVAGGLFFSTALAAALAVFAVGRRNIVRFVRLWIVLIRSVLRVFWLGVLEARAVLRRDSNWNWKEAWSVLSGAVRDSQRAAADGVEALRREQEMYFAVLGRPELIPLQYALNGFFPFSVASAFRDATQDTVDSINSNLHKSSYMRKLTLTEFDVGDKTPKLLASRLYDLGQQALAFDVDMKWDSSINTKIVVHTRALGLKVPVTVHDFSFDGTLRVELTPLTPEPPGYGAALVSCLTMPKIGLNVRVAGGDITKVPWLRIELRHELRKSIEQRLIWPKRAVIPTPLTTASDKMILSTKEIDDLATSDPFLVAEKTSTMKEYVKGTKSGSIENH